jgi:E3 ubiquitin-protein ligase CBL
MLLQQNDMNRPPQKIYSTPPISQTNSVEKSEEIKIVPNITQPATVAPPPVHQEDTDEDEDSNPICGPAETITGIIDTRPIEQRTNFISFASLTNNVTTSFNLVTINDTSTNSSSSSSSANATLKDCSSAAAAAAQRDDCNKASNTYLLKSNHLNNNNFSNSVNGTNTSHQRHMSVPVGGTPIKTLPTSSSTLQASISQKAPNTSSSSPLKVAPPPSTCASSANLQLYENVKVKSAGNLISLNNLNNNSSHTNNNNSNCNNVSYENINLEYINRLMKEGYSKENVMAALCISRNNFEMACDILHEFVSTNHQKACESNR